MKLFLNILIAVMILSLGLVSCSKYHLCSCKYTTGATVTQDDIAVNDLSKKRAKAVCWSGTETTTVNGVNSTTTRACTLK